MIKYIFEHFFKTIVILLVFNIHIIHFAYAGDCVNSVNAFLNQPNYKTFLELNSQKYKDMCWRQLITSGHNLEKLYKHTSKGNKWGIMFLIKHLNNLDGGELEDAYIALGESIDAMPDALLRANKDNLLTDNQLKQALVMLPDTQHDDKVGSVRTLKNRINKINLINDKSIMYQKKLAVKVINDHIRKLNEVWP